MTMSMRDDMAQYPGKTDGDQIAYAAWASRMMVCARRLEGEDTDTIRRGLLEVLRGSEQAGPFDGERMVAEFQRGYEAALAMPLGELVRLHPHLNMGLDDDEIRRLIDEDAGRTKGDGDEGPAA